MFELVYQNAMMKIPATPTAVQPQLYDLSTPMLLDACSQVATVQL